MQPLNKNQCRQTQQKVASEVPKAVPVKIPAPKKTKIEPKNKKAQKKVDQKLEQKSYKDDSSTDSPNSEDEWDVEEVLKKRTFRGKVSLLHIKTCLSKRSHPCDLQVKYLLKWRGYPDSENTWVSADALECPLLIAAFEEKAAKLKG